MNKTELVSAMAEKSGISKTNAEAALKAFTEIVIDEIKAGNKVQLVGFGTFEKKVSPEREGVNPQTGEKCTYPRKEKATCKMSKSIFK